MTIGLLSAFMLGFWGSLHCVGMCGGIVGVLNNSLADKNRQQAKNKWQFWLAYNIGRIFSYAIAGGIAAFVGSSLFKIINPDYAHRIGLMLSGLFLIAFGLYLSGWWHGLSWIEKKGTVLWQQISPFTQKFVPVEHLYQALCLGALWGWLPCGLVYSALVWMFTLPRVADGMIYMAAFGLGTLPMLLFMSGTADTISRLARSNLIRKIAGTTVIVFGVITFLGLSPMHSGHDHGYNSHDHSQHQHM